MKFKDRFNFREELGTVKPKDLFVAGITTSFLLFIALMIVCVFEIKALLSTQSPEEAKALLFQAVTSTMNLMPYMFSLAICVGLIMVYISRGLSKSLKLNRETWSWGIAALLGLIVGGAATLITKNFYFIPILVLTNVWGASFLSVYSGNLKDKARIEKIEKSQANIAKYKQM